MTPGVIARLAKGFAAGWMGRPSSPTRMVLALTNACNQRCACCRIWNKEPVQELTRAEIDRFCQSLPLLTWLDVTGGEIFVRPDATDLLLAIAKGLPSLAVLHFPTNGWFTGQVVNACMLIREVRPDVELIVTVTIDGPRTVHDGLRGRPGAFDRATDTLRMLRSIPGVKVVAGTTLGRHNAGVLGDIFPAIAAVVPGFSPGEWHWNLVQESAHYFQNVGAVHLPANVGDLIRDHRRNRGIPRNPMDLMEWAFLVILDGYVAGREIPFPCAALHSSCYVAPDGTVYPCHIWDRPIGNLRDFDMDIGPLWNSDGAISTRQGAVAKSCGGCFTPCEAYPSITGSPLTAALTLAKELIRHR